MSCVTIMTVQPSLVVSSFNNVTTVLLDSLSSDAVGSSARISFGVIDQRARHRDPLPLSAGERPRLVVNAMTEAQPLEDFRSPLAHALGRTIAQLHRHLHVLIGGQRVEKIMRLKDEAEIAPDVPELLRDSR